MKNLISQKYEFKNFFLNAGEFPVVSAQDRKKLGVFLWMSFYFHIPVNISFLF